MVQIRMILLSLVKNVIIDLRLDWILLTGMSLRMSLIATSTTQMKLKVCPRLLTALSKSPVRQPPLEQSSLQDPSLHDLLSLTI